MAGETKGEIERVELGRSSFEQRVVAPGVLYSVFRGPITRELCAASFRCVERELAKHAQLTSFADLTDVPSVDTAAREYATEWWGPRKGALASHVLFRSKLVEMGVALVSMALGRGLLTAYSDRRAFEAELARRAPGFRVPLSPQSATR